MSLLWTFCLSYSCLSHHRAQINPQLREKGRHSQTTTTMSQPPLSQNAQPIQICESAAASQQPPSFHTHIALFFTDRPLLHSKRRTHKYTQFRSPIHTRRHTHTTTRQASQPSTAVILVRRGRGDACAGLLASSSLRMSHERYLGRGRSSVDGLAAAAPPPSPSNTYTRPLTHTIEGWEKSGIGMELTDESAQSDFHHISIQKNWFWPLVTFSAGSSCKNIKWKFRFQGQLTMRQCCIDLARRQRSFTDLSTNLGLSILDSGLLGWHDVVVLISLIKGSLLCLSLFNGRHDDVVDGGWGWKNWNWKKLELTYE